MKPLNISKAKIKNVLGIITEPTHEDLLFEIVQFLSNESIDGEFKMKDVSFKTRVRVSPDLNEDVEQLVKMGYIEKDKTSFKIVKHLWE